MAPQTEHWQNHPPDSQAEAVAVAAGVVPATDLREAPQICSAGPQPYGFFRRGDVAEGKAAERTVYNASRIPSRSVYSLSRGTTHADQPFFSPAVCRRRRRSLGDSRSGGNLRCQPEHWTRAC